MAMGIIRIREPKRLNLPPPSLIARKIILPFHFLCPSFYFLPFRTIIKPSFSKSSSLDALHIIHYT